MDTTGRTLDHDLPGGESEGWKGGRVTPRPKGMGWARRLCPYRSVARG